MAIKRFLVLFLLALPLYAQISESWTTEQQRLARKGDIPLYGMVHYNDQFDGQFGALSIGNADSLMGNSSIILGDSSVGWTHSVVIGHKARGRGDSLGDGNGVVLIGNDSFNAKKTATLVGSRIIGGDTSVTGMGYYMRLYGKKSTGIGMNGYTNPLALESIIMGYETSITAKGSKGISIGSYSTMTENYSTAIGYMTNSTGSYSTMLGYLASDSGYANTITIGNQAYARKQNQAVIGNSSLTYVDFPGASELTLGADLANSVTRAIRFYGSDNARIACRPDLSMTFRYGGLDKITLTGSYVNFGNITYSNFNFGTNKDVELGVGATDGDVTYITLRSPNGTKYYVTVGDDGTLTTSLSKP